MAGWLLFAFALGILWADCRASRAIGAIAESAGGAGGGGARWLAGLTITLVACGLVRGLHRRPGAWTVVFWAPLLCAVLAFQAGAARLDRSLDAAARDLRLVDAAAEAPLIRRIDARVVTRKTTLWGIEVVLAEVRAADDAGPVPRRVLLSIQRDRPEERERTGIGTPTAPLPQTGPRPSRAERLLWPGAAVRLAVRIRPFASRRNPGTADREQRWARQGIAARARLADSEWVLALEPAEPPSRQRMRTLRARLERARVSWVDRIARRFDRGDRPAGLARALAVGDRRGLSAPLREAFRALGLSHLIAVSGLHVGLVAGLASVLVAGGVDRFATPLGRGPYGRFSWTLVAGTLSGAAYAWLAGAPPSAMRALALLALFSLARISRRDITPARALGFAGFAMLLWAPSALFELGPQLSFAACSALILGGVWQHASPVGPPAVPTRQITRMRRLMGWARDGCLTSLAVSLGTAPFVLAAGIPLAVISPLVNLVAIPWTGLVVLPASLGAALASEALPRSVLEGMLRPAQFSEVAAIALAQACPAAKPFDALPFSVAAGGAVAGLLAMRTRARWAAVAIWVVLSLAGTPPLRHGPAPPAPPRVVFFDVGQGDAALVEGERAAMLIDSGGAYSAASSGAALVRALRSLGVRRLDLLVVTHGDLDHRGGAAGVLSALEVDALWLPDGAQGDARLRNLEQLAQALGVSVSWRRAASRGTSTRSSAGTSATSVCAVRSRVARARRCAASEPVPIRIGDLSVEILWPPAHTPPPSNAASRSLRAPPRALSGQGERPKRAGPVDASPDGRGRGSWNDESLVLRVEVGGRRVLFVADVGAAVEARLLERPDRLEAEILKLGHHGSRKSTSAAFLEAVSPLAAVVSAPCDPTRGLPSREILERVERAGIRLAWTGRDGAVTWGAAGRAAGGVRAMGEWSEWAGRRRCRGRRARR